MPPTSPLCGTVTAARTADLVATVLRDLRRERRELRVLMAPRPRVRRLRQPLPTRFTARREHVDFSVDLFGRHERSMRALVPLLRAAPSPFLPLLCRTTRCTARSIARRREVRVLRIPAEQLRLLEHDRLEPRDLLRQRRDGLRLLRDDRVTLRDQCIALRELRAVKIGLERRAHSNGRSRSRSPVDPEFLSPRNDPGFRNRERLPLAGVAASTPRPPFHSPILSSRESIPTTISWRLRAGATPPSVSL